jgi:hypothetical protein
MGAALGPEPLPPFSNPNNTAAPPFWRACANSLPSAPVSWIRKALDADLVTCAATAVASPRIGIPNA